MTAVRSIANISLGILFPFISYTQDSVFVNNKSKQSIEFTGEVFLNSNTIPNNFILAFYNGEFIDEDLKQGVTDKIISSNRFGGVSKLGFTYSYTPLSVGEGQGVRHFSFSFFDRQHLDMKFTDDLFNTIFYGNKMFAGKTVSLGNFSLNFLRYQQFRFGWDWKGDFNHGSYGLAFSLLSGEQNIFVQADKADLFSIENGTFSDYDMDFTLAMEVQQTDITRKKYFAQNGIGLSTDFYYEMPYVFWKKHGRITFEVKDLGIIRWNSNSMLYSVDSSYHYNGVYVPIHFDSTIHFTIDSVIDKNTKFEKKQYTTNIPFTLDIHTKSYYGRQIVFEKGIICWFNTSAKPYYYAKLHFIAGRKKSIDFACVAGYGGYGRFSAGAEAKIDFAKHYSLHVIENYLFTEISQPSYGMGMYVKLARKF